MTNSALLVGLTLVLSVLDGTNVSGVRTCALDWIVVVRTAGEGLNNG
jgi:hypothetical protein